MTKSTPAETKPRDRTARKKSESAADIADKVEQDTFMQSFEDYLERETIGSRKRPVSRRKRQS